MVYFFIHAALCSVELKEVHMIYSIVLGIIPIVCASDNDFKLISKDKHEILSSHIPDSKDGILKKIRSDKRLLIYTEEEMPKAYQDWTSNLPGIHSPSYNISAAKPRERFGNPNVEFPWGNPAGTELTSNDQLSSFKFLLLPKDESIRIYKKYLSGDKRPSYVWEYPKGSIVGEVLQLYYKEKYYTFEVRLRRKDDSDWKASAYRPFSNLKDFANFCKSNGHQLYYTDKKISQYHKIFEGNVVTTSLEDIPESLVKKALSETFVNVLGQEWHNDAHAPTTDSNFHIIPKHYQAATIAVTTNSCVRCHESTLKHANDFDSFRDWYGRVRGSDGIFSFHPFDPSCISYSGIYQGVEIRKSLLDNGIVKMD